MPANYYSYPHTQLSGLEETLEYFEIEEKFASQMPKDGEAYLLACIQQYYLYFRTF